jgi:Zn-dependent alcohol dehydrogenase
VRAATGGRLADFVFISVGSAAAVTQGLFLLASGGALVLVGMPPTGAISQYEATEVAYRGQRILGSRMGSARLSVDMPRLVDAYREGKLKLDELITGRCPLEKINEAIDAVRAGNALRNVIVF